MNTVNGSEPVVILDPDQAEALGHLLGTVEDWLLHCGDEARDDLGEFLTGLGSTSCGASERLVAHLVSDLGDQAVSLRRALRRATEPSADIETGPRP